MCRIKSFRCKDTKHLYGGGSPKKFRAIQQSAERKLQMLDSAESLNFLKSPPGNRLEALKGTRREQYSIHINTQWRLCFIWSAHGIFDVEIVDYH